MFQKVLTKVFGSKEDRDVKKFRDIVEAVNQLEPEIKKIDRRTTANPKHLNFAKS